MPPRLITAGILLFWLTMTSWLVEREVVPMMIADASPAYQIDLTDEIGSPLVGWTVLRDGQRIGTATSKIRVNDDRTFEFRSSHHFLAGKLGFGPASIKNVESTFRVNEEGKLLDIAARFDLHPLPLHPEVNFELRGEVANNQLQPRLFQNGVELKILEFNAIKLDRRDHIVNPMHLMNRLRGLREGQTWKIPQLDLLSSVKNKVIADLAKQGMTVPVLIAEVKPGSLRWDGRDVACHKIEYYEPGKDVTARTWVRKLDGLVLQQEANFGFEMITQRNPN